MDKHSPKAVPDKEDASPGRDPALSCADRWRNDSAGERRLASEDDCLGLIDELFPSHSAHVPRGRGDDCALLTQLPQSMALSTDMFWEDTHFRTGYFTPEEAGGKALAAAVSDLAAAGAVPMAFSLGLMLLMPVAASRARNVARTALVGLLLVTIADAVLTVWPLLLVAQGDFDAIAGFGASAGLLRFVLALLQALGVVALVWALVRALRGDVSV